MAREPINRERRLSGTLPTWARTGARVVRRQVPAWRRVVFYNKLGKEGRLGNQLWQIAGTLGLAHRHNADPAFNIWPYADKFSMPRRYFVEEEDLVGHAAWTLADQIAEPFRVYLQDASLWKEIEARVRRYFAPAPELKSVMESKFAELLSMPNKTAVHVRRTDYVEHPEGFRALSPAYYAAALERVGDSNVLIFSDDPAWCHDNLGFLNPVAILDGNQDYEDFFIITQCQNHVVANSSFSWWGAYLSANRHPVVPRKWYGPAFYAGGIDESLMFLDGWTVIDS